MLSFVAAIVGERAAKPVLWALIILFVCAVLLTISHCSRDTTAQQQADQTTRSGDAIANAASDAIGTISNRTVTENDIDRATAVAAENIDNAQDDNAIRAAVIAGVCGQTSHRNDPACAVR